MPRLFHAGSAEPSHHGGAGHTGAADPDHPCGIGAGICDEGRAHRLAGADQGSFDVGGKVDSGALIEVAGGKDLSLRKDFDGDALVFGMEPDCYECSLPENKKRPREARL